VPEQQSPKHPVDVALGEAIRVARLRLDLLQEEVGLSMGASSGTAAQRAVSRLEAGRTITVAQLLDVARALGTTAHDLIVAAGLAPSRRPGLSEALETDATLTLAQRQALAALIDTFRSTDPAELRTRRALPDILADIPGISEDDRTALLATVRQRQRAARRATD
jgi:transcriptional regulator with XRE-family HTH domain